MVSVFATLTVLVMAWCAWLRRASLTPPNARPQTFVVLLAAAGLLALSPPGVTATTRALTLPDAWRLNLLIGHGCLIAAQLVLLHIVLSHLFDDENLRLWFDRWITPSAGATITAMTTCAIATTASAHGQTNVLDVAFDAWLAGYWLIVCAFSAGVLIAMLRALSILRRDPSSEPTAAVYIVVIAYGLAGCAVEAVNTVMGQPMLTNGVLVWALLCASCGGASVISARSWRAHTARVAANHPPPASSWG